MNIYRIEIFSKSWVPLTTLFDNSVNNLRYFTEVNKAGGASFSIRVRDPKSLPVNLRVYNKIIIYKAGVGKFIGYIEGLRASVNEIEVTCIGILGLFNKRLYSANIVTTQASTVVSNILAATNALDDTGITFGTTDVTYLVNKIDFSRSSILSAWQKVGTMANKAEIEITTNKELNFLTQIGTNKIGVITLQYNVTQINTANIQEFDVEVEGKDIVNKVTGLGDSGLTSIKSDAPSIGNFGLLEASQNFSQTDNITDLDNETQSYLDNKKVELYIPTIVVNSSKINIDTLELGDTITVLLNNGFIFVSQAERIIKKDVQISNSGQEVVSLSLSPVGTNVLPSAFDDSIIDLGKRVSLLEGAI